MFYDDKGLKIQDLSIGVSTKGLQTYKDKLEVELLDTVETKINAISGVTKALDRGWQGTSRDRFDAQFKAIRKKIIADLKDEYKNLEKRIDELAYNYVKQDMNMIID